MDELTILREKIDQLDDQLFDLLEQRFALSAQIKQVKQHANINIFDPSREDKILNRIPNLSYQREIQDIYQTIFRLSKAIQEKKN